MTVIESGPASIYDPGTAFTIPLMDSGSVYDGYWGYVKTGIWKITESLTKINYDYYSEVSKSFDPAFAYATTVLQNTTPTDTWENIGSSTLSTSTVTIDSNGVATSVTSGLKRGVFSLDKQVQRSDNDIPHIHDLAVCSSSLSMSLDSSHNNVVSARSSQESLNYTLALRATGKNWKNSSVTSTSPTQNFYDASLFGQPSNSGSLAIYSYAQGFDSNTLADTTETFTGEDFRIVLADNCLLYTSPSPRDSV